METGKEKAYNGHLNEWLNDEWLNWWILYALNCVYIKHFKTHGNNAGKKEHYLGLLQSMQWFVLSVLCTVFENVLILCYSGTAWN